MQNPLFRRGWLLTGLIFAAASSRLLPHAPNFTAVGAISLFAGATFVRWSAAVFVPLLALAVSDLVLGLAVYGLGDAFRYSVPVYLSMALVVPLGRRCGTSARGVALGGTVATVAFYLLTNAFFWATSGFYPRTGDGLIACYAAAIPFAANMWAANLVYGFGLVVVLWLAESRWPGLRRVPTEPEA